MLYMSTQSLSSAAIHMKQIFCEKVSSDLGLVAQFYLLVIMEIWPENSTAFYDENG